MFHIFKSGLVLLLILTLTACSSVVKKNESQLVRTLNEKNPVSQNQANKVETPISLVGVISHLGTGDSVANATVTIKVGNNFSETVLVTAGAFQIDNLPSESKFELVVHSANNAFMDKTFSGTTRASNSMEKAFQDFGVVMVASSIAQK